MEREELSLTAIRPSAFINQQNQLRGVLAKRRSHAFVTTTPAQRTRDFRRALRECLLHARHTLGVEEYGEYLRWHYEQISNEGVVDHGYPIGFDNLATAIAAPPVSLNSELEWIKQRLLCEVDNISQFRRCAKRIEQEALSGAPDKTLKLLADLVAQFGETMWSVQLRLGLEQRFNGLESQKKYYEAIRSEFRRGLLTYVAYHTSVRNEERTTLSRFREQLENRWASTEGDEYHNYFRYRLFNEWPLNAGAIADVLRLEQSYSIFDVYESFISYAQHVIKTTALTHHRPSLLGILQDLRVIDDFRIQKLLDFLDHDNAAASLPIRDVGQSSALARGDLKALVRHPAMASAPIDPWQTIYEAIGHAHSGSVFRNKRNSGIPLRCLVGRLIARSPSAIEDLADAAKLCINLAGLSNVVAIYDFIKQMQPASSESGFHFQHANLNSQFIGPEDLLNSANSSARLQIALARSWSSPGSHLWRSFKEAVPDGRLEISIASLVMSFRKLIEDDSDAAIDALDDALLNASSGPLQRLAASMRMYSLIKVGKRREIINLIASEASQNQSFAFLLPIKEAIGHLSYADFKNSSDALRPMIAMDMLWKSTESDTTASMLRVAVSAYLTALPNPRPSALAGLRRFVCHDFRLSPGQGKRHRNRRILNP